MTFGPFADLAAYVALSRLTELALSVDGNRLVATVAQPDAKSARYVSALWQIPLDDGPPVRLTHSEKGENALAFRPDGTLLFLSGRPDQDSDEQTDDAALWALPGTGEAVALGRRPGGLSGPVVARGSGHTLVTGSRLAWSGPEDDDAARRTERRERKVTAILHTGMPIRYWDHELGDASPRLLLLPPGGGEPVDLAPDATNELLEAAYSISADGSTVAVSWRPRTPRGRQTGAVAVIDVATRRRTVHEPEAGLEYGGPVLSPDGRLIAVAREVTPSFDTPVTNGLVVLRTSDGAVAIEAVLGDLWPSEWSWSPDSSTLYVSGDLHGRGAVVAIDPQTGTITRRLAADAVYSCLQVSPDGAAIYALRSAVDSVPTPVRLKIADADQQPQRLPTPAPTPALPGTVTELDVPLDDGGSVHAWLYLPPAGDEPPPVMQWIHGGPFMSYNSWSWRWNPWLAVARGWAVIQPDPALSTGYGQGLIDRAWPYRADVVWREVETVLDAVLQRPVVDPTRTALLGASFGGFMVNWIAGHTDRFQAIVSHAGLWALDQQHATTDAAHYKADIFGRLADHPDWYARYSPHNSVEHIVTPMLIVHGNRDYRVPVSEALRLWWDLVSRWDGSPADLPHRFLHFTGENHWVLSPANAEIWNDAVLGFCAQHVLGRPWSPSGLL
ncbi:MAG: prolyl oligopeptidase family serine peptidase [Jatrophihabitans sp.]